MEFAVGAGLLLAVLAALRSEWSLRRSASKDTVDEMRAELADCKKARDEFKREVGQLRHDVAQFRRENYDLLARVTDLK